MHPYPRLNAGLFIGRDDEVVVAQRLALPVAQRIYLTLYLG